MEYRCRAIEADERGFSCKRARHGIPKMFNWLAKWVGFQVKLKHRVGETGCIWGSGSSLWKESGRGKCRKKRGTEERCAADSVDREGPG